MERSLFLHHYLPAFTFKVLLMAALLEHVQYILSNVLKIRFLAYLFFICLSCWLGVSFYVFQKFSAVSYGFTDFSTDDIKNLRWKDTWDFIVHKT